MAGVSKYLWIYFKPQQVYIVMSPVLHCFTAVLSKGSPAESCQRLSEVQCVHGFPFSELLDCQEHELGAGDGHVGNAAGWLGGLLPEGLGIGSLLRPAFSKLW